jgi:hypothetical protein
MAGKDSIGERRENIQPINDQHSGNIQIQASSFKPPHETKETERTTTDYTDYTDEDG